MMRDGPGAGDATNAPAVESDDAPTSGGKHRQCAATRKTAGIQRRRRQLAG